MKRLVEPELLDELPPTDPRAISSRADLRRLNRLMRHAKIICATAGEKLPHAPRRIADLGAGDGSLMLALAKKMHRRWPDVRVTLVDRQKVASDATLAEFKKFGWHAEAVAADVQDWVSASVNSADAIFANLFLHHLTDRQLADLFRFIPLRTDFFLACETRRTMPSLVVSRLLWLMGCNAVTRHDAVVSMNAGFASAELSNLWPTGEAWQLEERGTALFTHLFVAQKN